MLESGTRLGPYEVIDRLGAGGMGEVYRALDPRLGREIAVKILPEHLSDDPEARERFEREAKAIAAISHPNILSIHDFGVDSGIYYTITELLVGTTLRDRIRDGHQRTIAAIGAFDPWLLADTWVPLVGARRCIA